MQITAVCVNFSATRSATKEALAEYQPLVLEGKTPGKDEQS